MSASLCTAELEEPDLVAPVHDPHEILYSHLAWEIPFSLQGMSRILTPPTRAQE